MKRLFIIAAGCVILAALSIALLNAHVVRTTRAGVHSKVAQVEPAQVAVVLGAKVYRSGKPSPQLADRLEAARILYHRGRVERIIVSGDHAQDGYDEVNAMRTWLMDRGVPSADIFMDHAGLRTLDTVARARRVFGAESVIFCTHRFHTYRALYLAKREGLRAQAFAADRRPDPGALKNGAREAVARVVAVLDTTVDRQPKFLGPKIDLRGHASQTHD